MQPTFARRDQVWGSTGPETFDADGSVKLKASVRAPILKTLSLVNSTFMKKF
jgi:hypothetical protein